MASILLIEDEQLVGTMVQMNLESNGFHVTWIKDGQYGLEKAQQETFDLIVLDISLPQRDGLSILQELRKQKIVTPVMMLTANSHLNTKVDALEKGADDYLAKPFDVPELLARVQVLLRRNKNL